MAVEKRKALGKGISSLMETNETNIVSENSGAQVLELDINKVSPNVNQPRTSFSDESIEELADSIKEIGIIQPITVKDNGEYYEIVTGERRWRAARVAGLDKIPAIVVTYDELKSVEAALIENVQREDLNPVDEAKTYKRLADEFGLKQEDIAKKVGKSRVTITNAIRLLNLDERVLMLLQSKMLTSGQVRPLISLENGDAQFTLAEQIIEEGLSARQVEEIIKKAKEEPVEKQEPLHEQRSNPDVARACLEIAKDLKSILGTKVRITNGKNKGKIEIEYYSPEELDRIVGLIKRNM